MGPLPSHVLLLVLVGIVLVLVWVVLVVVMIVLVVMLCYVLVSGEPQAAELTVSTKLHLPQSLVTHLNSIISIII